MTQPADLHTGFTGNSILICPQCGQQNDYQVRECSHCGIDLALATGMAVLALAAESPAQISPMTPEILVPRLGEILTEKKLITQDGLKKALVFQKEKQHAGQSCLFGQSLLSLGLIDRETLDAVITDQILQLQRALQESNRQLEKRVEDRTNDLQQALLKLSELNQLKSNFVAGVSHELRTPLTHLKGYLLLLSDGELGDLPAEQRQAVEVMLRAEGRLEQLIDDLIHFSLMSRGELSLNKRPGSVADLIHALSSKARKLAEPRQVEILVDLQADLPYVEMDVEKISWVLLQLLDNAIKFTPPNGQVILSGGRRGELVALTVKDNGIGISGDKIEQIFEPFYQLDGADTRKYGGTGLGLALVRRIIEMHGSVVQVSSEVGMGSTFEFTLPACKDD